VIPPHPYTARTRPGKDTLFEGAPVFAVRAGCVCKRISGSGCLQQRQQHHQQMLAPAKRFRNPVPFLRPSSLVLRTQPSALSPQLAKVSQCRLHIFKSAWRCHALPLVVQSSEPRVLRPVCVVSVSVYVSVSAAPGQHFKSLLYLCVCMC